MNRQNTFKKAEFIISERRMKATRDLDKRLEELYKKEPDLKEINDALTKSWFTLLHNLARDTKDIKSNDSTNFTKEELLEKRREILSRNHLDESYLQANYTCEICKDRGFIEGVRGSKRCACLEQVLIDLSYGMANLEYQFEEENFQTFNKNYYSTEISKTFGLSPRDNIENILQIIEIFISEFPKENKKYENLFLYGDVGLGKTFLCNAIAKEILDRGKVVFYVTSHDLFRSIEKVRFNQKEEEVIEDLSTMALSADLLIIDDLGTEFSTTVTRSAFFSILNDRIIYNKPTIISTNLNLGDIKKEYSDRVLSRIVGSYTQLRFFGEDIRLKKKFGEG